MSSNRILIVQIRKLIEAYARFAPESGITIPDFQSIQTMNHNQLIGLRMVLANAIASKTSRENFSSLGISDMIADTGNYVPLTSTPSTI